METKGTPPGRSMQMRKSQTATIPYLRLPRLLHDLAVARGDGSYPKLLASLAKLDIIVLDDFGLAKLNPDNRRDLLELLEDRYATRSTLVTSQLRSRTGTTRSATHLRRRDPRPPRPQRLQAQTQRRSMRKKKTPLTQADPLNGIIEPPRRFRSDR